MSICFLQLENINLPSDKSQDIRMENTNSSERTLKNLFVQLFTDNYKLLQSGPRAVANKNI